MTGFTGYICWEPDATQPVFAPMVESATDAIFTATHMSLPAEPTLGDSVGQGPTTEAEILEAFLTNQTDPLVMAVVGPAGSGKTHIIKWLHAHTRDDPQYLVVYVTREETNLRLVLKSILEQLPGDEPERLLKDIRTATDSLAPHLAIANVYDFVTNRIEYDPPPMPDSQRKARDFLCSASGLPTLLRHRSIRDQMLSEDGVIAANVRVALHEYDHEQGPPPRFEPDQLRLDLPQGPTHLSDTARGLYGALQGAGTDAQALRIAAADLLNLCLDSAISDLLGLSASVSLVEVMSDARRLVAQDERDLVLLIEDFALFDRIGRPLTDAIAVPARSGLAKLRTAFAMTSDPYQRLPETLRSRVALEYQTGQLFGADGINSDRVLDFVGTYLNALRLGPYSIQTAWNDADPADRLSGEWVANACDRCSHEVYCRSGNGFGQSSRGHGLYPLNRAAIDHLAAASLESKRFVPRTLLTKVLAPLTHGDASELADGQFPSAAFEARTAALPSARTLPPPAAEVAYGLEARGDPHRDRRLRLLRLWQDKVVTRAFNLHETIHEAFDLPPLDDSEEPQQSGLEDDLPGSVAPPAPTDTDANTREGMHQIDVWVSDPDSTLAPELAAGLRDRLHELVTSQLRLNDRLMAQRMPELAQDSGLIFSRYSFEIERGGGRSAKPTAQRFRISATPANGVLLKTILRLDNKSVFSSVDEYSLLFHHLDTWAKDVISACRAAVNSTNGSFPVRPALEALIATAWVHPETPSIAMRDPVQAVLAAMRPLDEVLTPGAAPDWSQLLKTACGPDRERVRTHLVSWVQAAQGAGGVQAINIPALVEIATPFLENPEVITVGKTAENELRALAQQAQLLTGAVSSEASRIERISAAIDWDVVDEHEQVANTLINAVRDSATVGVFEPGREKEHFERLCGDFASWNLEEIAPLRSIAGLSGDKLMDRLEAVRTTQACAARGKELVEFVELANDYMQRTHHAAEEEMLRVLPGKTPSQAEASVREAAERAIEALRISAEGKSKE